MRIFPILIALLGGYGAVYCFRYYMGKVKLENDQESERKKKVEKHGFLIILAGLILSITSIGLVISAF